MTVKDILKKLIESPNIEAAAVISRDGLLVESELPMNIFAETFAIMCATMLGAAVTANSELKKSPPDFVVAESAQGAMILSGATKKTLLVCVTASNVDIAPAREEMKKAIAQMSDV